MAASSEENTSAKLTSAGVFVKGLMEHVDKTVLSLQRDPKSRYKMRREQYQALCKLVRIIGPNSKPNELILSFEVITEICTFWEGFTGRVVVPMDTKGEDDHFHVYYASEQINEEVPPTTDVPQLVEPSPHGD